MVLTDVLVGKRDERENKIIDFLVEALINKKKGYYSRESLNKAMNSCEDLAKNRGKIYFNKYPDMNLCINKVINHIDGHGK